MNPRIVLSGLFAGACYTVRVRAQEADADFASMLRNTQEAKDDISYVTKASAKVRHLPYSESRLESAEIVKTVADDKGKCFYLRRVMKPETVKVTIDIAPTIDKRFISGAGETTLTVTSSTAKIDTTKLGWSKDRTTEVGGGAGGSASVSGGIPGVASFGGTFAWNVYGSHRWGSGESGDQSQQTEFTKTETITTRCPARHICTIATWTYTKTISGSCYMLPIVENACYFDKTSDQKQNVSVAVFTEGKFKETLWPIMDNFFEMEASAGIDPVQPQNAPEQQDVKMHDPSHVVRIKHETECSFSHPLRNNDAKRTPFSTQAHISVPVQEKKDTGQESKDEPGEENMDEQIETVAEDSKDPFEDCATKNAVAKSWTNKTGCELENGCHYYPTTKRYWVLPGTTTWEERPDLAEPKGLEEICPMAKKASLAMTTQNGQENGQENGSDDTNTQSESEQVKRSAKVFERAAPKASGVPKTRGVKVKILKSEAKLVMKLAASGDDGF
ncbi:hypothetical protein G6O67_005635 [Ophiocordyceps sinensis]|uniref:Aerolysin-like toxin, beta complex domain protein n=2 Tax=Ophiocordyceps sinensis TaxID=72228 RepID=A0A8H4LWR2_9HYPO|nr:Aerolysin-like toxin, beta complex domain protein [Ophiocordyceps sinensis CO18]KAF4506954.1 hypothetical protein G6O67_005635 [Ophiocordyceps sinensis]